MWISKKKFQTLEKRIADLEGQVQSQQIIIKTKLNSSDCDTNDLIVKNIEMWQRCSLIT